MEHPRSLIAALAVPFKIDRELLPQSCNVPTVDLDGLLKTFGRQKNATGDRLAKFVKGLHPPSVRESVTSIISDYNSLL